MTEEEKLSLQAIDLDGINVEFVKTCREGDLEKIQYLLTSSELTHHAQMHITRLEPPLSLACYYGHLELVQYFLTDPIFKNHIYIHAKDDDALVSACTNGHIDIVQYLLSSEDLKEHANIHARNNLAFHNACQYGHLEVIQYLLTSSAILEHSYTKVNDNRNDKIFDYVFKQLLAHQYINVIEYFIFDYQINHTPIIKDLITELPGIQKMFVSRDFNDKLQNSLSKKDSLIKKVQKI